MEGRRRRRQGRARAFPARPAALAAENCAARLHPARAQSRTLGADRRQCDGVRTGLRAALRARPRRQAALCDDRGFPQLREACLHGAVDPSLGRHGVRAGRRAGQQAPSRHGLCAYALFGQAVHGLGHGARTRRRYGRDVQGAVRREIRRGEHGRHQPDQRQLADGVRRNHAGRGQGLCAQQPGDDRHAVHPGRGDEPGDGRRHADAGARRGAGRRSLRRS